MARYSLSHLSDSALLHDLSNLVARDRAITAELLAHLAEVDERKLYLPAGYPSMFAWCVGVLHLGEQAALKRIQVARAARAFPAILDKVASGDLCLSSVVLLAPHLTEANTKVLLASATHKTRPEIERLLAERFPRPDVQGWVGPLPTSAAGTEPATGSAAGQLSPGIVHRADEGAQVKPLSSQSFAIQFTLSQRAHEKLRYAQKLLGHAVPSGNLSEVVERALDALIPQLEKRKLGTATRPRTGRRRPVRSSRHIPAHVREAVWKRDGGRCTFVSDTGHRCEATHPLEFDHVVEVARGGEATVDGIRLLCRAHNQYAAERTFGSEFMRHKRIAAAEFRAAAGARAEKAACARAAAMSRREEPAHVQEVIPCLRALGYRAGEARDAAALCEDMPDATLEQRVRVALSHFRLRGTKVSPVEVVPGATPS